jgi:UDP-3-O-[3-hydroxymyristoyl] N-acetylglucosamine deacetylase
MEICPAPADHGILFTRTDVKGTDARLPARWDLVDRSPLCSRLLNAEGVSVSTVEHIMAALSGCGVHNALILIDGPEVPILDGSALPFVRKLINTGLKTLSSPLQAVEVLKTVEIRNGDAFARLEPSDCLEIDFSIDFNEAAIGRQTRSMSLANGAFARELCDSRTFCRQSDVDAMRAQGLALGGTTRNAVVFDGDNVLSPGGLRHKDEPVRHKMLDALGDLALAGAPILGRYVGHKSGHAMTNTLLRALFADENAWQLKSLTAEQQANLPGAGVNLADICAVA